ncbi:MAG: helix-turn-helix domain-containing protein [Propionibacteriaceae bacterium]|nr:helix-turn-helix domain-containing protein [Propionibacteriaceae bacterium]
MTRDPRDWPPLLSTFDTADYLGVPRQTLANWRTRNHAGPVFLRVGRKVMYRRVDVDAWVESRRTDPGEAR